jgi:hypothetical protein
VSRLVRVTQDCTDPSTLLGQVAAVETESVVYVGLTGRRVGGGWPEVELVGRRPDVASVLVEVWDYSEEDAEDEVWRVLSVENVLA